MDDNNNEVENTKVESEKVSESDTNKIKIGTLGNFVLAAFIILIIGTGSLTYYLITSAKEDYDKQYNELISNMPENITEETEVNTIADMIDSAIVEATNSASTNSAITDGASKKLLNESLVVLYNGLILDTQNMDEVTLQYIDSKTEESEKYVITYYSYENFGFKESKLGVFSPTVGDGLTKIDGVGKVAISEDYNAIPRDVKVVNTVPAIVLDNNPKIADYTSVKTLIVDLDGNGADEYILILANKSTGFSKITLIDSKGAKVSDLASIEKSKWKKDSGAEYYLNLSNVETVDIDNDGIMEILVEIPHATDNSTVSLLKYNNGILQGKSNIECSLLTE